MRHVWHKQTKLRRKTLHFMCVHVCVNVCSCVLTCVHVCISVSIRWLWLICLCSRGSNSRLRWEWSLKESQWKSQSAGRQTAALRNTDELSMEAERGWGGGEEGVIVGETERGRRQEVGGGGGGEVWRGARGATEGRREVIEKDGDERKSEENKQNREGRRRGRYRRNKRGAGELVCWWMEEESGSSVLPPGRFTLTAGPPPACDSLSAGSACRFGNILIPAASQNRTWGGESAVGGVHLGERRSNKPWHEGSGSDTNTQPGFKHVSVYSFF